MASQGRLIASDQYSREVSSIQTDRLNCLYKLLEDTIPMNVIIEYSSCRNIEAVTTQTQLTCFGILDDLTRQTYDCTSGA